MEKEIYEKLLKEKKLSFQSLKKIEDFIENSGMKIEKIQKNILREQKITGYLRKLNLYFCRGKL